MIQLNRIYKEELGKKIREVIGDLNSRGNNPCTSAIQTNLEMQKYFVTQSDLQETLQIMNTDGQIEFIASRTFPGGGYKLK
jgi:hypothetical protein